MQITARSADSCLGRRFFSWVITPGVAPTITSGNNAAFIVGQANSFTVTATGAPTPTLSVSGSLPSGVTFVPGTGVLSGTPDPGTGGTYPLTVTASNGILPNASQLFTLTVNQRPSVSGGPFSLAENSPNNTSVGTATVTDPHTPAQTHTWSIAAGNTGTAFAIDSSGQITVATSSALNFETTPTFSLTVQATDNGTPNLSGSATITVNLSNVNEGPTAVSDTITVAEGGTATTLSTPSGATSVLSNDSDPDVGDTLTVTTTPVTPPSNGILTLSATGTFSYTHNGSETTTDSFIYQICDPGPLCATATVFITITAGNDAPVLTLPGASVVYDTAGTPVILDAAATVTDIDSPDFDTGVLTANVTTACDDNDRLSVRNEGTGAGQIGVSGVTVTYNPSGGAVPIGTIATDFVCGSGPALLAVTLTANATPAAVQALVHNLTYSNSTPDTLLTTQRMVTVVVTDGDGGTSNTATKLVDLDASPQVSTIVPANAATVVATNSTITINFSEAVTLSASAVTLNCGSTVAFTGLPVSNVSAVTLAPSPALPSGVVCTVTVVAAQVTDQDTLDPPNMMAADFVSTFTTVDAAPTVLASSTPAAGELIATNETFTLNFSEAVDVVPANISLTCNSATVTFTNSSASNVTTITLTPTAALTEGASCTLSVPVTAATDTDTIDPPDQLGAAFSCSFTVDVSPSVTSTSPVNGATNVAASTNLSITFSEPVNISGNWFQIVCGGQTKNPSDTAVSGGPTTFTINPTTDPQSLPNFSMRADK